MDAVCIKFEIQRDGERVTGFSLAGCGDTEAESFCFSFPTAINRGKADINFANGSIIFIHKGLSTEEAETSLGILGVSSGGTYSTEITPEDQRAIQDLLALRRFRVRRDFSWGKGFTLYSV